MLLAAGPLSLAHIHIHTDTHRHTHTQTHTHAHAHTHTHTHAHTHRAWYPCFLCLPSVFGLVTSQSAARSLVGSSPAAPWRRLSPRESGELWAERGRVDSVSHHACLIWLVHSLSHPLINTVVDRHTGGLALIMLHGNPRWKTTVGLLIHVFVKER